MKKSKFKLTFTLQQHTPMIHFQHDQAGATLRGTELKPKLDRFIIKKMGGWDKIPDNWKIGGSKSQHHALDYKVRIHPALEADTLLPLPIKLNSRKYPYKEKNIEEHILQELHPNMEDGFSFLYPTPFFANADKIKFKHKSDQVDESSSKVNEIVFAVQSKKDIECDIFCLQNELLENIKKSLMAFFIAENFGTRQNKGFGSFTVKTINSNKIKEAEQAQQLQTYFAWQSTNRYSKNDEIFQFITKEYQLLKSGKNHNGYAKSKLFEYFIRKDIRWEKRYIKKVLNKNGEQLLKRKEPIDFYNSQKIYYNQYDDKQKNEYRYVRAVLGLAENIEFSKSDYTRIKVKISDPQKEIGRFKSPIFFKVIDGEIFLSFNESYKSILGKTFHFDNKVGNLNVPEDFNLKEFLENHLSNNWKNTNQ